MTKLGKGLIDHHVIGNQPYIDKLFNILYESYYDSKPDLYTPFYRGCSILSFGFINNFMTLVD